LFLSYFLVASAEADVTSPASADQQFTQAAAQKKQQLLAPLLNENFTWTDQTGKSFSKSDSIARLTNTALSSDIKSHEYGSVVYLTGVAGQDPKIRFVRVWVKNQQGEWQLLLFQETKQVGKVATPQATVPAGTPCDNPCKTIPYDASSAEAKNVVASWQALEDAVNHRDADGWASHVADEFVFNVKEDGNPLTKADRVAIIRKQAEGKTVTDIGTVIPGTMKVWIYGNTAVMSDEQQPTIGGHPYRAMRIWVKRDGRWQLVYSQQTVMEGAQAN
jgi:ketosteroid isomerase-like protein